jgi:hypothetical protein
MDIAAILREIDTEIENIQTAKALLARSNAPKKRGRQAKSPSIPSPANQERRTLSAEAKARIAEAQRKRWAKRNCERQHLADIRNPNKFDL